MFYRLLFYWFDRKTEVDSAAEARRGNWSGEDKEAAGDGGCSVLGQVNSLLTEFKVL